MEANHGLSAQQVSSEDVLKQLVSFNFSEISVADVLKEIEKATGVSFSYSSRQISSDQKTSFQVEQVTLEEALNTLFAKIEVTFSQVEGKLILKKKPVTEARSIVTLHGYVTDAATGETLLGATILVRELHEGTATNPYGFYSASLPVGDYTLMVSYIGHVSVVKKISLQEDIGVNLQLSPNISELAELVITTDDSIARAEGLHNNIAPLDKVAILNKPSLFGEADVVKSLDLVPGVQLFRDGSTFFNVRGGDRDQNQILVDDAPIYNPSHFLGLFSSLSPEAIKDIQLYKGDLPASVGGRIASVLDIKTREGNLKRFGAEGNLSLISGRLTVEGPIKKEQSSFFVTGRRSIIGGLIKAANPDLSSLYFSDFNAKANVKLNANNRLYLSIFGGTDDFLAGAGIRWQNRATSLRWNHSFGSRLFSNTTFYTSRYDYQLRATDEIIWKNHISNASLKSDLTFFKTLNTTLKFGINVSGHNFNPGNVENSSGEIPAWAPFVPKRNASELVLYGNADKKLSEKLLITYGARLSSWTNFGRTIEYEFDKNYAVIDSVIIEDRSNYNEFSNLEPRLSLSYFGTKYSSFKLNYTRAVQYLMLISNSISPFNNLEVWLPASINLKPQIADQASVGWFYEKNVLRLGIEAYYKHLTNQVDYISQARLLLNPHLEGELRAGRGEAYGLETTVTKTSGQLTGWVSYSYSRSFRQIEGINNGEVYASLSDKPHQFLVNGTYLASQRLNLSGTFYVSSGAPVTTPTAFYQFQGRVVPVYGAKNNDRLPVYHRFDVSLRYQLNKRARSYLHYLSFSLFNLYSQKNSILENFNKIETPDGEFVVPAGTNTENRVISTRLFVYTVVPSVTYSFKL